MKFLQLRATATKLLSRLSSKHVLGLLLVAAAVARA